eukprot:scaffold41152_cov30-Prasinocladus_malaysianus.AAC.1
MPQISHGHTGIEAAKHGDPLLAKICGSIAADEARHEIAYTKIVDEIFARDPSGAMLAFSDMMRKQIVMPAHLMNDNQHYDRYKRDLFTDFSAVAERLEVYTAKDYADIMEHLVKRWDVPNRTGLTPEAAKEQEYLCKLPDRVRKLSERAAGCPSPPLTIIRCATQGPLSVDRSQAETATWSGPVDFYASLSSGSQPDNCNDEAHIELTISREITTNTSASQFLPALTSKATTSSLEYEEMPVRFYSTALAVADRK